MLTQILGACRNADRSTIIVRINAKISFTIFKCNTFIAICTDTIIILFPRETHKFPRIYHKHFLLTIIIIIPQIKNKKEDHNYEKTTKMSASHYRKKKKINNNNKHPS